MEPSTLDAEFTDLVLRARSLANAAKTGDARALLEEFLTSGGPVSAEEAYVALSERMAIPLVPGVGVLSAAQQIVLHDERGLLPAQEADFYLIVTTAMFELGEASFADCLRSYRTAVDVTSAHQAAGLAQGRSVDQRGFLAGALLDVGAFEEADVEIAAALGELGMAPVPSVDATTYQLAVERLLDGDELHPAVDLRHGAGRKHAQEGVMESVAWIRQLEAEAAAQRGDHGTSVALYQALACFYQREVAAFSLTAAQVMADGGERAEDACSLLERLRDTEAWREREIEAVTIAAAAFLAAGVLPRAQEFVARARGLLDEHPNIRFEPDVQLYQARVAKARGNVADASAHYSAALSSALERRWAGLEPRLDDAAMRAVVKIADEAIRYFLEVADSDSLLRTIDSVKSARLQAVLTARESAQTTTETGVIAEQVQLDYRGQLTRCAAEVERLNGLIAKQDVVELRRELIAQLDRKHLDLEDLLGQARLYDPVWVSLVRPGVEPIQVAELGAGATAVSLYRIGTRLVSVTASGTEVLVGVKEMDDKSRQRLTWYADNIASAGAAEAWFDPAALGLEIEDYLTAPTIEAMLASGQVVLAPHDELHLLPWAMMQCRERRLVEHVDVAQSPNLACLAFLPAPPTSPRLALFCPPTGDGNTHLTTAEEVAAIRAVAGERALTPALGDHATVERLSTMLASEDVDAVHVASHGVADRDHLLGSGIVAADRVFSIADLDGRRVHASLFSATSCVLGWRPGELRSHRMAADEALGLPAAFMAAGGSAMIASITPAEDAASAEIARIFYEEYYSGRSALAAWASAQRRMLTTDFRVSGWCTYTYFGGPGPAGSEPSR